MVTGSDHQHEDVEGVAEDRRDGGAPQVDASNVDAGVGTLCPAGEADRPAGIDDAEPAKEQADREPEPDRHSAYEKVMNLNKFIDQSAKGLDPISAMIWLTLFRFARGGIAWASQKTIAARLGLAPETVYRHLALLKKKKLVRVVKQGQRGGRCNTYQLGILPLEPVAKRPERLKRKPR